MQFHLITSIPYHTLALYHPLKWLKQDLTGQIWIKPLCTFCALCTFCQQAKIYKNTKSTIWKSEAPSTRFWYIRTTPTWKKPPKNLYLSPYRYILTCADRTSRRREGQPISEITTCSGAEAFVNAWITRWSVLLHVKTDQKKKFESESFAELSKVTGFYVLNSQLSSMQWLGWETSEKLLL